MEGVSHILLIGDPDFLHRQPIVPSLVYGAYVLCSSNFVAVEHMSWYGPGKVERVAVPTKLTGAALGIAYGTTVEAATVVPWGYPEAHDTTINRTEIRQLLAPHWDHRAPVVLAEAEYADSVCAALARTQHMNALLLGSEDQRHATRIGMHNIDSSRVAFTTSRLAWDAADIYLSLKPCTYWPWDVAYALSRHLVTATLKAHVYEVFSDQYNCTIGMSAYDAVMDGPLCYRANSTDILLALQTFLSDVPGHTTRTCLGAEAFAARTPEVFTRSLMKALFNAQP